MTEDALFTFLSLAYVDYQVNSRAAVPRPQHRHHPPWSYLKFRAYTALEIICRIIIVAY